jgi:hypothetical protein
VNDEQDGHTDIDDEQDDFANTFSQVVHTAPAHLHSGPLAVEDFVAFPPNNTFIYLPCREAWSAAAIDAVLPMQQDLDRNGQPRRHLGKPVMIKPSKWLLKHLRCEQMSYWPGKPLFIRDQLTNGSEWIERPGACVLNTYKEPTLKSGDASKAARWVEHWHTIYPDNADYIIKWLAQRAQDPGEKINHGLLLGSKEQGVGKDSLLQAVKYTVGASNYEQVKPQRLISNYSNFVRTVILHVSEIRDTATDDGERIDRFALYDHLKDFAAAPPDVLYYVDKYQRGFYVTNCLGLVFTTNYSRDSIYIPPGDRRFYVAWTEYDGRANFSKTYWTELWNWYRNEGGFEHVAAYLRTLDISDFDPKAPPPETEAHQDIVDSYRAAESDELADALDALERPAAVITTQLVAHDVRLAWMIDHKNGRRVPYRMEANGYAACRAEKNNGRWIINGKRHVVYVKAELNPTQRRVAAAALLGKLETKKEPKS